MAEAAAAEPVFTPPFEAKPMIAQAPVWNNSHTSKLSMRCGTMGVYSAQAKSILARIGDSPEQVGETLRTHGASGVRNAVRMLNPVIRFLQKSMPPSVLMDLMDPKILRLTLPDGMKEEVLVPQPVMDF